MKAQFQKTDGPLSPRGNERFVEATFFFATPKMWSMICAVAKVHGVLPTFMVRTILMCYLDLYAGPLPKFTWTDDRSQTRSKKIHLSLTPSTRARLDQVADFHGMPNAQIIRMALQDYFSRHPLSEVVNNRSPVDHVNGTGSDVRRNAQKRGVKRRTGRGWGVRSVDVPEGA